MKPNSHNARNFSQCDSMLIGDQEAAITYRYIQVEFQILKSLISFIDSLSYVIVSLNFIAVGLEWVKKINPIIEYNKHPHVTTCHNAYSLFYTIRSEKYDMCTTKNPSRHDESSLSMEIETKNHKISMNL